MFIRTLQYLVIFVTTLLLVNAVYSNNPTAGDLVLSTGGSSNQESAAINAGEDAFTYTEFQSDNSTDTRKANQKKFEKFITNDENAGLLLPLLLKFDEKSLQSLKAGIYEDEGYLRSMSQAGGTEKVLKKAEEALWKEHKLLFQKRRTELKELIEKLENTKGSISGGESNPRYKQTEENIRGFKKELDEEEKKMRASFRLNLKAIEKELNFNYFGRLNDDREHFLRFNSSLLNSKDSDLTAAAKTEFVDHKGQKSSHSIFRELDKRVAYVMELAKASGKSDSEARKWALVYILSWQFTKSNFDIAMKMKSEANSEGKTSDQETDSPGSEDEESDNNSGNGSSASNSISVDIAKWNNEQRSRYNEFINKLKAKTDFDFMGKKFSQKEIIGAYSGVNTAYAQGMPKLQDNLEKVFLPKAQEYKNNPKFKADTSAKANKIKALIAQLENQMKELKVEQNKLRAKKSELQTLIDQYDNSLKVEDLGEKTKLVNFLQQAVQKGATVSQAQNLSQRLAQYTQQVLHVVNRTVVAFESWKALHEKYKEWEETNVADRLKIIEWIKNFDKRRVPISDLHNYGKVAAGLMSYVKTKHAERFDSLNIPFASQITTSCLSLIKDVSFEDIKLSRNEDSSVLDVAVDSLDKKAEKRLFCYAHYEWIMKEQASKEPTVKLFDDGRDTPSLAISMRAIYEFMGEDRESVKTPENFDYSIYEGMDSFLRFVDNFRKLFIAYLKNEFKKRGKHIEELSGSSSSTDVTVQNKGHDSVSFRFPAEVLFDTLKSDVKPEGRQALKDNLPILLDVLGTTHMSPLISSLKIEGHADSRSAPNYTGKAGRVGNDGLSDDRAEAVYAYWNSTGAREVNAKSFIGYTINVTRKGYGATQTIKDQSGKEDMDMSRRVEIKFGLNLEALAAIKNDWEKLQEWNIRFNGDLNDGTGGEEIPDMEESTEDSVEEEASEVGDQETESDSLEESTEDQTAADSETADSDTDQSTEDQSDSVENSESTSSVDTEVTAGYPTGSASSKRQLDEYASAVERSGQSAKVGSNDLFKVEGEGWLAPFSKDQVYRNVKLNEPMIQWLKENKDRVRNHDAYYGTNYSEQYDEIYNLYVNEKGEAKSRPLNREDTWRGPALDKDKFYTLPVTEDMKTLQSIIDKMDENYSTDVSGAAFEKWKQASVEELNKLADSARLMGYPSNDQTLLYNYEKGSRELRIKQEVADKLLQLKLAAHHYDQAHRPESSLTQKLKTLYDELVDDRGEPRVLYHSKPTQPGGGHARRNWTKKWSKVEVTTPQDLDTKIREFASIIDTTDL